MKTPRIAVHVARLTPEVRAAASEFKLLPAGEFRSRDGRPANAPHWIMTAAIAARLIAECAARETAFVIDYEHQTLLADANGQPAPAAGWFKALAWREGDGLYAVGVTWTERASAYIAADEYRYISPVFTYDKQGRVLQLLHVALTNNPALDSQPGVAEAVAAKFSASLTQETHMDELLERCRWLLNLPITATAEECAAELQKLIDQLKAGPAQAAASFDLATYLTTQVAEVAALKGAVPDPAKFAPVAALSTAQAELIAARNELTALRLQRAGDELDGVIAAALTAGKILPAQELSMRTWGGNDIAALKGFLAAAPVIGPVTSQTGGKPPVKDGSLNLSEVDLAVCKMMGIAPEEFRKTAVATAAL